MGVKGLWKIVDKKCSPKSCTLQQFSNKTLVIDASIWSWQFSKGFAGRSNSLVIKALLKRICSLLINRIKVIFVFDGSLITPLKQKTLQERLRKREEGKQKYEKLLRKYLLNNLIEGKQMDSKTSESLPVNEEIEIKELSSDEIQIKELSSDEIEIEELSSDEFIFSDLGSSSDSQSPTQSELNSFHSNTNSYDHKNVLNSIDQIQSFLQKAAMKGGFKRSEKLPKRFARDFGKKFKFVKNSNTFGYSIQKENEEELIEVPIQLNNELLFEEIFENKVELQDTERESPVVELDLQIIRKKFQSNEQDNIPIENHEIILKEVDSEIEKMEHSVTQETIEKFTSNSDSRLLDISLEESKLFKIEDKYTENSLVDSTEELASDFVSPKEDSNSSSILTEPQIYKDILIKPTEQLPSKSTLESLLKQSANPGFELRNEFKYLLDILGIPWIEAEGDAEIVCTAIQNAGLADFVVSDDNDALLFGASRIIRHLFHSKKAAQLYDSDVIPFNRSQLIMFAYLLGSDYSSNVTGIGPIKATNIVSECKNISDFLNQSTSLDSKFTKDLFDFYFNSSNQIKLETQLQQKPIDIPKLIRFMHDHANWPHHQTIEFIKPILEMK